MTRKSKEDGTRKTKPKNVSGQRLELNHFKRTCALRSSSERLEEKIFKRTCSGNIFQDYVEMTRKLDEEGNKIFQHHAGDPKMTRAWHQDETNIIRMRVCAVVLCAVVL